MKRKLLCLIFAACLAGLVPGCGQEAAEEPDDTPQVSQVVQTPEPEGCVGSGEFSESSAQVDAAMVQPVLVFMHRYYQAVGNLTEGSCDDLFVSVVEADGNEAVWRSLIAVREASLIDLHLVDYDFTLTITDVEEHEDGTVTLTITEDAVTHFAGTEDVDSEEYGTLHYFTMAQSGDGSWLIDSHSCEGGAYYNFVYDEAAGCDARLDEFLQNIAQRQAQRSSAGAAVDLTWDHDYDRQAAYTYMQLYIQDRSSQWMVYDDLGGNCQNFGSQVLHAGGIPMDETGDAQWFWHTDVYMHFSWINVGDFMEYAQTNTGYGLVADANANYYDGQAGDILIMGAEGMEHTTVIAQPITDANGDTIDYLICSNTSNYRNYPVSAYYYTKQWVVRIFGWND